MLTARKQQELLIDALLIMARSERGLDHLQPVDLADIIRDVLDARAPDPAAQGLAITAAISPSPVLGDARLLERLAGQPDR